MSIPVIFPKPEDPPNKEYPNTTSNPSSTFGITYITLNRRPFFLGGNYEIFCEEAANEIKESAILIIHSKDPMSSLEFIGNGQDYKEELMLRKKRHA